MTTTYNPARRRKYPPIVRTIGSIAFCDSGAHDVEIDPAT